MANGRVLVSTGTPTGYLMAMQVAKERGKQLPSIRIPGGKKLAWRREILVFPPKKCTFREGDITDSASFWTVPASFVPKEALGRTRVGLLLDPGELENIEVRKHGSAVIHPLSVALLSPPSSPFLQKDNASGKIDPATGIPVALKPDSEDERGTLVRSEVFISVVPLSCLCTGRTKIINAFNDPKNKLEVELETDASEIAKRNADIAAAKTTALAALFGMSLEQFERLLAEAHSGLDKLRRCKPSSHEPVYNWETAAHRMITGINDNVGAIQKLLDALSAKE